MDYSIFVTNIGFDNFVVNIFINNIMIIILKKSNIIKYVN